MTEYKSAQEIVDRLDEPKVDSSLQFYEVRAMLRYLAQAQRDRETGAAIINQHPNRVWWGAVEYPEEWEFTEYGGKVIATNVTDDEDKGQKS